MAAQIAINNFRTVTQIVPLSTTEIYTAPTGYTSVFLLAQCTNIGNQTYTINFNYKRGSTETEIVKNFPIPAGDTVNLLPGKLVLETGDKISVSGSNAANLKFLVSILETSNF
jgi:hypothetical protein